MRAKSVGVAAVLAFVLVGAGVVGAAPSRLPQIVAESGLPQVSLEPEVVLLGGHATVRVAGWRQSTLEVALAGATDRQGRLLGWRRAQLRGGTWWAELPRPALRGIYPLLLRDEGSRTVVRSPHWLLRIYRRAAAQEPTFASPQEIVRWWVQTVPHRTLAAFKQWPQSALDKRDPKLHRVFVVAYNPPRRPGVANRLGRFVTAVREGYAGRWRLLEATVQP
jgi:hypothetical protein